MKSFAATFSTPKRRALLYVIITFILTWSVEFGVIWPLATSSTGPLSGFGMGGMSAGVYVLISSMMFMPMLGMLITRALTREGLYDAWIKPIGFKRTWPWWILAWLGPIALTAVGALICFIVFPADFDPSMSSVIASYQHMYAEQGMNVSDEQLRLALTSQVALVFVAPFMNFVSAFGEEWGWRGYLLPKLLESYKIVPTIILMSVIWGLWHLPLTLLGHNYGMNYVGYPFLGVLAMCWFCFVVGTFLSLVTLKTGTCLPAALAHGCVNGCASAGVLFTVSGGNALVGPAAVGVLGGAGFALFALITLFVLHKREKAGVVLLDRKSHIKPPKCERPMTPADLLGGERREAASEAPDTSSEAPDTSSEAPDASSKTPGAVLGEASGETTDKAPAQPAQSSIQRQPQTSQAKEAQR